VAVQNLSGPVRRRHWPFSRECRNIRGVNSDRATRIYQWLYSRASFFRSEPSGPGTSRTVRTEVTVEQQATTLLVGGTADFDICPLCGQKLAPEHAEQAGHRVIEGSIPQVPAPRDRPPPRIAGGPIK
jgi:hypothetical protein